MAKNRRRVVVTGMGVVSSIGSDLGSFWESLREGRSGIGPVTLCDVSDIASQIAGEVRNFDPLQWYENAKEARKADRFSQFAMAASLCAVKDAGLVIGAGNELCTGVLIGSGIGGLTTLEQQITTLNERGPRRISPFMIPMVIANLAAGNVSIRLGAKGPNSAISTACSAGTHAIGESFHLIRDGYTRVMVCGGAEATINRTGMAAFSSMRALSLRNDEPQRASRPFDKDRDGFVLGEGSGILVLEDLEYAIERGAPHIHAEVIGYGLTSDAWHISAPSPDGDGAARCMAMAIDDADLTPGDIDYVNAHGTSTDMNDRMETMAIKKVFANHAYRLKISATKSMIGHLLGAGGGVESIASILTIKHACIPPTINLDQPDQDFDLDYVPHRAVQFPVQRVLKNSFGFGGTNACVVYQKYER